MDVNDRRFVVGSGDFNNPRGDWSVARPEWEQTSSWGAQSYDQARFQVHTFYRDQKDTGLWREATRLAKRRTDHQFRQAPLGNGIDYADAYHAHLTNIMSGKGRDLADRFGELKHRQDGYGRTQ